MINHAIIIGNLGKDAELRIGPSDRSILLFSVCTNFQKKDHKQGMETLATWHSVVAFGPMADYYKTLKKGDLVCVIGERIPREYKAKDGTFKRVEEINASKIRVLHSRANAERDSHRAPATDDLPF